MGKREPYEKGSLIDIAVKSLEPLKDLFESDEDTDKLLGLNMTLVFFVISFSISFFLDVNFNDISSIVVILVSFIFGAIVLGAYAFFASLFKKIYKIKSLNLSISVLFLALPLSLIGLLYKIKILISISLLLIFFQFVVLIIASLFVKKEYKIRGDVFDFLGKTNIILGIISSLITIGTLILKFI